MKEIYFLVLKYTNTNGKKWCNLRISLETRNNIHWWIYSIVLMSKIELRHSVMPLSNEEEEKK